MTLTTRIEQARRGTRPTATRANRDRQRRAELRLEEIVKTAGIPDAYERVGRSGDLAVETAFATAYQLVNTERERDAVLRAFMVWEDDERGERAAVRALTGDVVADLKLHNRAWIDGTPIPDEWLNGAAVPANSDGAA